MMIIYPPGRGGWELPGLLCARVPLAWISIGDACRSHVQNATPLGVEAKRFMEAGSLVPFDITMAMVRQRLSEPDAAEGFILDNFPHRTETARQMDKLLAQQHQALDLVVHLILTDEEILQAHAARRWCHDCGQSAVRAKTSPGEDHCALCGGMLDRLGPDIATMQIKLHHYRSNIAPLIEYYSETGRLTEIAASGTDQQTADAIAAYRRWRPGRGANMPAGDQLR